jgi:hypothetical protein
VLDLFRLIDETILSSKMIIRNFLYFDSDVYFCKPFHQFAYSPDKAKRIIINQLWPPFYSDSDCL